VIRQQVSRLIASTLVLASALCGLGILGWVALDRVLVVRSGEGRCWRFGDHDCWDLSPGFIARATGITLPSGTVVRSSSTHAWLSWSLSATVVLPRDAELPTQTGEPHSIVKIVGHTANGTLCEIDVVKDGQATPWPMPK
jgi:hypothetical protein